jgi:hypothetical protein
MIKMENDITKLMACEPIRIKDMLARQLSNLDFHANFVAAMSNPKVLLAYSRYLDCTIPLVYCGQSDVCRNCIVSELSNLYKDSLPRPLE